MVKGIATMVGVAGTGISMFNEYQRAGGNVGEKLLRAMLGYTVGGNNDPATVGKRLVIIYGPAVGGVAISKASGRFGINRSLPKGINL